MKQKEATERIAEEMAQTNEAKREWEKKEWQAAEREKKTDRERGEMAEGTFRAARKRGD